MIIDHTMTAPPYKKVTPISTVAISNLRGPRFYRPLITFLNSLSGKGLVPALSILSHAVIITSGESI